MFDSHNSGLNTLKDMGLEVMAMTKVVATVKVVVVEAHVVARAAGA